MFFSTPNVFAVGDCADSPGWRSLVSAQADAATVAANVAAALSGGALKKHKAGARVMVVPLGPGDGVSRRLVEIEWGNKEADGMGFWGFRLDSPRCHCWEIACSPPLR